LRAAELGAGEILVTSIDREGTGLGFDVGLTRRISEAVPIPVVAGGGASTPQHVAEVVRSGRCQGVALASMLHYGMIEKYRGDRDFEEGVTAFLQSGRDHSVFAGVSLAEIKTALTDQGIATRPWAEAGVRNG
jgi:imidazole glycerol-phosphate synthase subunit HisF